MARKLAGLEAGQPVPAGTSEILVVTDNPAKFEALSPLREANEFNIVQNRLAVVLDGRFEFSPDLIILDLDGVPLPLLLDDFWLLKSLYKAPLLGMGGYDSITQAVSQEGTDFNDFIFKPFSPKELVIRTKLLYKRIQRSFETNRSIQVFERRWHERRRSNMGRQTVTQCSSKPAFKLDDQGKRIYFKGRLLELGPKEYDLLRLLLLNAGKVLYKQEIIEHLWSKKLSTKLRELHVYIHKLRSKVEENPLQPCWIETIQGSGYRLRPDC